MDSKNVKYLELLPDILKQYAISRDDVCIVGSSVLSVFGLKGNNDLDFAIKPSAREKLVERYGKDLRVLPSGTICYNELVQSLTRRYRKIGISNDEELVNDDNYYFLLDGWKFARLEIELAASIKRDLPKDHVSLELAIPFLSSNSNFDWDFFRRLLSTPLEKEEIQKIVHTPIKKENSKVAKVLEKIWQSLKFGRHPKSNQINLELETDTRQLEAITSHDILPATLLAMQFENGIFCGYDVIKYYTMIDSGHDFSTKQPILINTQARIVHGAQQLAWALYHNMPTIRYQIDKDKQPALQEFDKSIVSDLEQTKNEIFLEHGIYFCVVLWGAAKSYWDQISKDVSGLYNIVHQQDLPLESEQYNKLIDDIYASDDVVRWKVLTKKELLMRYAHEVRYILIDMPHPNFRVNKRNYSYLSDNGAMLKKMIRNKYASKIPNYFYDIICHTGDNNQHNRKIFHILQQYIEAK